MSAGIIALLVFIVIFVVCALIIFVLSVIVRDKNTKIRIQNEAIKHLECEIHTANKRIAAANKIQEIATKGRENEKDISATPDDSYDPNGVFERFKSSNK